MEPEGLEDGCLLADGTPEMDGSFDRVGLIEGTCDEIVGPSVAEGAVDGEGVGTCVPVGPEVGFWLVVGTLDLETVGAAEGDGVGTGEPVGE